MHKIIELPRFTKMVIWSAWHKLFTEVRQVAHKPDIQRSLWPTTGTAVPQTWRKLQLLKKVLTWNTSWPWGTWRLLVHIVFHYTVLFRNTIVWRTSDQGAISSCRTISNSDEVW